MIKILAIPGSLRSNSSSNFVLKALASLAPANVIIEVYDGIGTLPHFNDSAEIPPSIARFRESVGQSDAVMICTPEYAFGIPGSLKNALDWAVSSGEFYNKPVGLITASSQGEKGHAAMLLVLSAIAARVIEDACILISSVRSKLDDNGSVKDDALVSLLQNVVHNISNAAATK